MPFKIIETIERGRRLITTVPSIWEIDGNLYWPKKNLISLKKNEKSEPKSDWKCLPCILLRDNILDYKTAEHEIVLMSDATDTDDKENDHLRKKSSVPLNLNNLAMECVQFGDVAEEAAAEGSTSMMVSEDASSVVVTEDLSSYTVVKSNALIETGVNNILIQDVLQENTSHPSVVSQDNMLHSDDNLLLPDSDQRLDPQFTDPQTNVTESIEVPQQIGLIIELASSIQENQKVLFENQQNILKSLALLNTKFEEFVTRSQESFQEGRHEESSRFKMITNIEELIAFEEHLKDPLIETKYFEELSIICSEKKSGYNNAYALVDTMFDRKFMTRCSWGGGTKGEPKHCFKAFSKTINLFLKVVHQYDKTFTKPICEDFFKNVMRHSLKRNLAKRVRNSTTKKKIKKSETVNILQENRTESSNANNTTQYVYCLLQLFHTPTRKLKK